MPRRTGSWMPSASSGKRAGTACAARCGSRRRGTIRNSDLPPNRPQRFFPGCPGCAGSGENKLALPDAIFHLDDEAGAHHAAGARYARRFSCRRPGGQTRRPDPPPLSTSPRVSSRGQVCWRVPCDRLDHSIHGHASAHGWFSNRTNGKLKAQCRHTFSRTWNPARLWGRFAGVPSAVRPG